MNQEQTIAQDIRKFVRTLGGLSELAPGLESLGSMKQAEQEARARLELVNKEVDRLKDQSSKMILEAELQVKQRFDDAAAELYKFQVEIKKAEDRLADVEKSHSETVRMYNDAKTMLDEIVRKVRA